MLKCLNQLFMIDFVLYEKCINIYHHKIFTLFYFFRMSSNLANTAEDVVINIDILMPHKQKDGDGANVVIQSSGSGLNTEPQEENNNSVITLSDSDSEDETIITISDSESDDEEPSVYTSCGMYSIYLI